MKRRIIWQRLLFATLAVSSLFVFLTIVPIVPYHPNCGSIGKPIYLYGPLRPEYEALLEEAMQATNISYFKWDQQIYTRYLPIFDGDELFEGGHDFFSNVEWRIIQKLAKGNSAGGEVMTPPQALMEAIRATEHKYGLFPPEIWNDTSGRFENCAVMRAGAIQVKNM